MWRPHPFETTCRTRAIKICAILMCTNMTRTTTLRPASQLSNNTSGWRTRMISKAFSAPSATPRATTTSPGANTYDDEPWGEHFNGRDGVRQFYEQLMKALPDLQIEIQRRHVTDDAIILEVMIRGTQLGAWRGLPATGRRVDLPLCGIYTFDADNRLAGEKIYYDRGTVLRQLGVFHEPPSVLGQISILLTHPITIARALARKLWGK